MGPLCTGFIIQCSLSHDTQVATSEIYLAYLELEFLNSKTQNKV